jgi:hypothetical protein
MTDLDALIAEMNALTVEVSLGDLNPAQRAVAERLTRVDDIHEIKRLSITRFDGRPSVTLYVETGRIGDEGTLASIIARDTTHVAIGPRGGVKYL